MGKSSYRPRRNNEKLRKETMGEKKNLERNEDSIINISKNEYEAEVNESMVCENEEARRARMIVINKDGKSKEVNDISNIKEVGDTECEYHVFIEDYVYTYIYQLGKSEVNRELSAMLVGEVYKDSKEAVIRGIIPINMNKLGEDSEWIDGNILDDIEVERMEYFNDQDIIGWMHLQPGYGTMLTMKEQREHSNVFEGNGSICILVDTINKIESVFVYEDEELKEQSGFCMYYERNEAMQRYMLEHSFDSITKEEMKDNVVNQFREIGKVRKAEYTQRKNLNFSVMLVSTVLIALTALMVRINDDKRSEDKAKATISQNIDQTNSMSSNNSKDKNTNSENRDLLDSELYIAVDNELNDENLNVENKDNIVNESKIGEEEEKSSIEETNKNVQAEVVQQEDKQVEKEVATEDSEMETGVLDGKEVAVDYIYVVKEGQTLANIAYDIYGDAKKSLQIAEFNNLKSTNEIYYGQELKIPHIE